MTIQELYNLPNELEDLDSLSKLQKIAHNAIYVRDIAELTTSEIRVMCSQDIYPEVAVPKAIELLNEDPFIDADFYEGDLLLAVLKVKKEYWRSNKDMYDNIINIYSLFVQDPDELLDLETLNDARLLYDRFKQFEVDV